jgi:hypothetical protein
MPLNLDGNQKESDTENRQMTDVSTQVVKAVLKEVHS